MMHISTYNNDTHGRYGLLRYIGGVLIIEVLTWRLGLLYSGVLRSRYHDSSNVLYFSFSEHGQRNQADLMLLTGNFLSNLLHLPNTTRALSQAWYWYYRPRETFLRLHEVLSNATYHLLLQGNRAAETISGLEWASRCSGPSRTQRLPLSYRKVLSQRHLPIFEVQHSMTITSKQWPSRLWYCTSSALRLKCAQFPPKPEGITTLKSRFHKGVTISYKEPGICETTPGVKSHAGYVHLPPFSINETHEDQHYPINTFFCFFEARSVSLHDGSSDRSLYGLSDP